MKKIVELASKSLWLNGNASGGRFKRESKIPGSRLVRYTIAFKRRGLSKLKGWEYKRKGTEEKGRVEWG